MASVKGGIIAKKAEQQVAPAQQGMMSLVRSMEGQIAKALPSVITPERFTRMVLTALSSTPQLNQCSPKSFLGAMMQAAQLGVEPNTPLGQAYLIPYRNHGNMECQFQLGYKGMIDLAYRSGEIISISAHEVCENDEFSYELGLEEKLYHKPALTDRGPVILYYATFKTKHGGCGFAVMSVDDVRAHMKKFSKAAGGSFSPWSTNFDEMAKKTVLKKCLKYAPIKTDFVRAVSTDETIKSNIVSDMTEQQDETVIEVEGEVIQDEAPAPTPQTKQTPPPDYDEVPLFGAPAEGK